METFKNALNGIIHTFKTEGNFKVHLIITILVIAAGFFFHIDRSEWLVLIIMISLVTGSEMFNTAVECIADFISPEYDDNIKIIKDVSAGAVLISAVGAVITGLIIFIPRIIQIV
jgi:diacylglycerol kinase